MDNKVNRMYNTKVREVSLVSRGAIDTPFDCIKSVDKSIIIQKLLDISDQDVVDLVHKTNNAFECYYNKTKGGETMDPEVMKILDTISQTVSKSYGELQKSVDDIAKKVSIIEEKEEDAKKAEKLKNDEAEKAKMKEDLEKAKETGEDVKKLATAMEDVTKSLSSISELTNKIESITAEIETLKSLEQTSNALSDQPDSVTVNKSASGQWPSFFGKGGNN